MRHLLILLALAACAPAPTPDLRAGLTRAMIDASPQPVMLAEIPARGVQATLAPDGDRAGTVTWTTAQGQALSFRGGVLIATRGLGDDLMSADVGGTLAALAGGPQADYPRLLTFLDGDNQTLHRAMLCRMAAPVADPVVSFGVSFPATRHDETCNTTGLTVENHYWLAPDGSMRRSDQWIGPALGHLATEILTR